MVPLVPRILPALLLLSLAAVTLAPSVAAAPTPPNCVPVKPNHTGKLVCAVLEAAVFAPEATLTLENCLVNQKPPAQWSTCILVFLVSEVTPLTSEAVAAALCPVVEGSLSYCYL
ncbi:MAG: hypothetical protein QOI63_444 [Thermoplasmata archaeon]|nr:hypothetical protein [Thermoplasmata archaeon]